MPYHNTPPSPITINKPRGRLFGSKGKAGESIRWGFVEAYRQLGGVDGLVAWGRAHPDLFYPMLTKLLPAEMAERGHGNTGITVIVQRNSVSAPPTEILPTVDLPSHRGGDIPDRGERETGPDVGTLTHQHERGTRTHERGEVQTHGQDREGGYFGYTRQGKGSPTGG